MLSIHTHRSAAAVIAYHKEHLTEQTSNYYSQDESQAHFFGKGLEHLGIKDAEYSAELFKSLCNNSRPDNKGSITPRRKEGARCAYDCTISAPKSVSVMALLMDDKRIIEAHQDAVNHLLDLLESRASVRVRKNNQDEDKVTGNITGASFLHFDSRKADPNLHTHACLFNFSHDKEENRFKALQVSEIFKASGYLTETYRSVLTEKLHAIGYRTRSTAKGFEIEGVPSNVIDLFSKRRKQILKIEADLEIKGSKKAKAKARATIARNSRPEKESFTVEDSRKQWLAQLQPEQVAELQKLKDEANGPIIVPEIAPDEALDWAKRHLFERSSVVTAEHLMEAALSHARGHFSPEQLESTLERAVENGTFLASGNRFTTKEALEEEQELISLVNEGYGNFAPLNESFPISGKLTLEQREVVGQTLLSTDRFCSIHGPAGTGKTTTLQQLVKGIRSSYGKPTLLAPSGSAADILRQDNFPEAMTLQRFLLDESAQKNAEGGVVIIDESGMVSTRQMLELARLSTSEKLNFRIILVGDSKQHSSTERGEALRILETHSNIKTASLKTIYRQKNETYRAAVSLLKDGRSVDGFDLLDSNGSVREITGETAAGRGAALATDFSAIIAKGRTALVVSPTWREAGEVTTEIRTALRLKGLIKGEDTLTEVLVPLHQTQAQREEAHMFSQGAVLVFQRESNLFKKGEQVSVVANMGDFLTVKRGNGETVIFDPKKHATAFGVFSPQSIPLAVGDILILRANGKSTEGWKLINGQRVTIKSIDRGEIELTDGRTLPSSFRQFGHGVCISSQASQGKTVDHVFLSMDAQSAHAAASLEGFYVAASRGRYSCTVFTDDKSVLREAIKRTSAKQSAMELAAEATAKKIYAKPNPTPNHPITKPVSDPRQLADTQGRYPVCRPSKSRHRRNAINGNQPANKNGGSPENELLKRGSGKPDLSRSGLPGNQIRGSRDRGYEA